MIKIKKPFTNIKTITTRDDDHIKTQAVILTFNDSIYYEDRTTYQYMKQNVYLNHIFKNYLKFLVDNHPL